jgi:hypothetical protein
VTPPQTTPPLRDFVSLEKTLRRLTSLERVRVADGLLGAWSVQPLEAKQQLPSNGRRLLPTRIVCAAIPALPDDILGQLHAMVISANEPRTPAEARHDRLGLLLRLLEVAGGGQVVDVPAYTEARQHAKDVGETPAFLEDAFGVAFGAFLPPGALSLGTHELRTFIQDPVFGDEDFATPFTIVSC